MPTVHYVSTRSYRVWPAEGAAKFFEQLKTQAVSAQGDGHRSSDAQIGIARYPDAAGPDHDGEGRDEGGGCSRGREQ